MPCPAAGRGCCNCLASVVWCQCDVAVLEAPAGAGATLVNGLDRPSSLVGCKGLFSIEVQVFIVIASFDLIRAIIRRIGGDSPRVPMCIL